MKTRYIKIQTVNEYEYFANSTGGNNRKWVQRYNEMRNTYEALLKQKPRPSKYYIEGFKRCMDIFHRVDNVLKENEVENEL